MSEDRQSLIRTLWLVSAIVLVLMGICASTVANAQVVGGVDQTAGTPSDASPLPKVLEGVGYQQRIGSQIPLDATFTDETGKTVPLRTYLESARGLDPGVLPVPDALRPGNERRDSGFQESGLSNRRPV